MRQWNVIDRAEGFLGTVTGRTIYEAEEAAKSTWPDGELVVTARC
jgi:hypothetical protein